jgi:hypothetical protein
MRNYAKPLNQSSGMPQMGAAFAGWAKIITIYRRNQIVIDELVGYVDDLNKWDQGGIENWDTPTAEFDQPVATVTKITFKGTIQPLSAKQISLKPEGQRSWEWLQIHCFSGPLNLDTNDIIIYNGKNFKIMGVWDYSLNNYIEYHAIRDYQDPPNSVPPDGVGG